jgi:hypothetical protein
MGRGSDGFTHRLDRLKHRATKCKGPPAKVYNIFNTVIGLSHLCCQKVLYFLNNPSDELIRTRHYCYLLKTLTRNLA